MPNGINTPKITAIMHLPKELPYAQTKFLGIVKNILQQFDQTLELIILDHENFQRLVHLIRAQP